VNTYVVQNLVLKNKNYNVENEFLFKYTDSYPRRTERPFMFWGLMHQNINNLSVNTYVVQNLVLKNKNYDVENEFLFKYRMLKMDFCCKKLKQIMLLLFLFCFVVVRVLIWCCCLLFVVVVV
jgi:hypothetical protein